MDHTSTFENSRFSTYNDAFSNLIILIKIILKLQLVYKVKINFRNNRPIQSKTGMKI